jgi:acetyl esterase/lipase
MFKKVKELPIYIDIYLPSPTSPLKGWSDTRHDLLTPVMLFIHGGGWTGSNRSDYSRPLFQHFLDAGFIVTSMDYRLVPESSNLQQLEDVKDVEQWLRKDLAIEIGEKLPANASKNQSTGGVEEVRKVVVVGASAGGQLGLLVVSILVLLVKDLCRKSHCFRIESWTC